MVHSRSTPEGPLEAKPVEEIFVRAGLIYKIRTGGRVIRTTDEHPFYIVGKGWVKAGFLKVGDLCVGHDGTRMAVDGVEDTRSVETVYNMRVADFHTYFVGCQEWGFSVWAHNADCHVDAYLRWLGIHDADTIRAVQAAGGDRAKILTALQENLGAKGAGNLRGVADEVARLSPLPAPKAGLNWGNPASKPTYGHTYLEHDRRVKPQNLIDRARGARPSDRPVAR